jgi:hypothetical protein
MSWLSDASANRIKKAYIKNFFDLSGNFKVRNAETTTTTESGDSWNLYGNVLTGPRHQSWFGRTLSLNAEGNIIAVGSQSTVYNLGAQVYAYNNETNSWSSLGSRFAQKGIMFIDINAAGDRVLVGTKQDNYASYIYDYNSGTSSWSLTTTVNLSYSDDRIIGSISGNGTTFGIVRPGRDLNIYRYSGGTPSIIGTFLGSTYINDFPVLSYDGNRIVLGNAGYDTSISNIGRMLVFEYSGSGTTWNQVGSDIVGTVENNFVGGTNDISDDGNVIVTGSFRKNAVYVYEYINGDWSLKGTPLPVPANESDFAKGVKISGDGNRILVNDNRYPGYSGPFSSNTGSGAMWVFEYVDDDWTFVGDIILPDPSSYYYPGLGDDRSIAIAINRDGTVVAGGMKAGHSSSSNSIGTDGLVNVFNMPSITSITTTSKEVFDVSGGTISMLENTMDISSGLVDISGTTWINRGQSGASVSSAYQCGLVVESSGTSASNSVLHVETAGQTQAFSIRENGDFYSDNALQYSSDDRRKIDEQHITNATDTLLKLYPQIYTKLNAFEEYGGTPIKTESGLIAQEVYYNAPELRHLVHIDYKDWFGNQLVPLEYDASGNKFVNLEFDLSGNDIQQDPNYTVLGWGKKSATVDYIGLIPYLIKSNQEQDALIKERQTSIDEQAQLIQQFQNRVTALENK